MTGMVKQLEQQLQDDSKWMAAYQENQRAYVAERWANCSAQDLKQLDQLGYTTLFDTYGIGGLPMTDVVRKSRLVKPHHASLFLSLHIVVFE